MKEFDKELELAKREMSAFQRRFLNRAEAVDLFTQEEFDKELELVKQDILRMAIAVTRDAISIEREICAKIAEKFDLAAAEAIRSHADKPDAKD